MPLMKIENLIGIADTFTWTYNPNVFDASSENNHVITRIPYQQHHIVASGDGIEPRPIILTGHHSGTSKRTYYQNMKLHFDNSKRLKKLYFQSDKFYLGIGQNCKETNAGGRTNFIDYVASFTSILGISLGATEKTSGTNEGNVQTYVTEIIATVDSGASDAVLSDDCGNTITIPNEILITGNRIRYYFVQMVSSGAPVYVSKYGYFGKMIDSGSVTAVSSYKLVDTSGGQNFLTTVNVGDIVVNPVNNLKTIVVSVDSDTELTLYDDIYTTIGQWHRIYHQISVEVTAGTGMLRLNPGANISTITLTNLTTVYDTKFRDGWCD